MMIYDDLRKSKLDFENIINLLDKCLESFKRDSNSYETRTDTLGKNLYDTCNQKISLAIECKESLSLVSGVIDNKVDKEAIQSAQISFYQPRKLEYISDIGKYRTEVLKAKKSFETLLRIASISRKEEIKILYQDCITKLNYVYNSLPQLKGIV